MRRIINLHLQSPTKKLFKNWICFPGSSSNLVSLRFWSDKTKVRQKSHKLYSSLSYKLNLTAMPCDPSRVSETLLEKFSGSNGKYLPEISLWVGKSSRWEIELLPSKWMILIPGSGNGSGKSRWSNDPRPGKVSHSIGDDQHSK